jgi:hypothetical protein
LLPPLAGLAPATARSIVDPVRGGMPGGCKAGASRLGRVEGSFKAVEDQVEPVLEFVGVVVAGLEDVLDGQLGEVGVLAGGELRHDCLRDLGCLLRGVERQAGLLHCESVDVAVEGGVPVGGQLDREACVSKASDHGIVVSNVCGTGRSPRFHNRLDIITS